MSAPAFAWALEEGRVRKLPTSDRMVLVYLADKANGILKAWPSQATIADNTGLTDRAVRISTGRLEVAGLIRIETRGKSRLYHVLRPVNGSAYTPELTSCDTPQRPELTSDELSTTPELTSVVQCTTPELASPTPELTSGTPELTSAKPSSNQEENLKTREEGEDLKIPEEGKAEKSAAPTGCAPSSEVAPQTKEGDAQMAAQLAGLARDLARGFQNNYPPRAAILDREQQQDVYRALQRPKPAHLPSDILASQRRRLGIHALQEP